MSLGLVIKGPEGLVLAAESRVTLQAQLPNGQILSANFDNATKLLTFAAQKHVAAVTYGQAAIGLRSAHSFLPELEDELPQEHDKRLPVKEFAETLSTFYQRQWAETVPPGYAGPDMTFVVAGFNEKESYGRVLTFDVPSKPTPVEHNAQPHEFGITWGGQREIVDRLLRGYDHRLPEIAASISLTPEQVQALMAACQGLQMPLPLAAMPLQDCVDLAIFFIRTTIDAQRLSFGIRGCGGPVDVAVITRREGFRFVQRKEIAGEDSKLRGVVHPRARIE